ncbi:MAG: nucleotide exchange factor GrpE [Ignavibacteriae bacterium]|nr:MAG: nucleotide exchange factor GrpE [Ignavibacteriota bacterium]
MSDTEPNIDQSEEMSDVETLQQQVLELRELAQRKAAEVENIRRRAALEKQQLVDYASEHFITRMLPVIDDLHAAVEASKSSTDFASLHSGIEMIYTKAVKIFEDAGVRVIEGGVGEPFNVDVHEALMHMPSEQPEGHVVQVIQRGYQIHDKVIRHAKVVTSAGGTE